MALLWSKKTGGVSYEVRTAGNSVRLYTDGVFHSQYNPAHPVTGSVWDLLFLPVFFFSPRQVKRILVLGVGGGAVIRQLLHFIEPDEIVGIELSATHLRLAKKFFGLRSNIVSLIQDDAVQWVRGYKGPKFDLIIDDIFAEHDGEPVRAVQAGGVWFNCLLRHLTQDGLLVSNFVSYEEMKSCAYFSDDGIRKKFAAAFRLTTPVTENSVGVFLKRYSQSTVLRKNIVKHPELKRALKANKLRYNIRRIDNVSSK